MQRWLILLLLVGCLGGGVACADPVDHLLATHPIQRDLTILQVVQNAPRAQGAVVEWRGMASHVRGKDFILEMGPWPVTVRNARLPFQLHDGDPVSVTGRVVETGKTPVLQPLVVSPRHVQTSKGIGWNPNIVTQYEVEQIPRWHEWMLSFNHRLDPNTAGLYVGTILQWSKAYRIDPRLVLSIVAAESAFEKDAVSKVGAIGLGQLMPDTAVQMGVLDIHNPVQNLQGCIRYLYIEEHRWQGAPDWLHRVVASYNAGEGAVEQYNGVPPYAETQAYVVYVLSLYRELGGE